MFESEGPAVGGRMKLNETFPNAHPKAPRDTRLSFHQASGHLAEREPGYYLILLRTELRHRSLRRKVPSD